MSLLSNTMQMADYARNAFFIQTDADSDPKDLLAPSYWAHVAMKFHVGDHIEVLASDGAYYAELLVLAVGPTWARMMFINLTINSPPVGLADPEAYYVKWSSPTTKFRVHRTSDKEVVADGFESKVLAGEWLDKFQKDNNGG